jgi:hypothetical protein
VKSVLTLTRGGIAALVVATVVAQPVATAIAQPAAGAWQNVTGNLANMTSECGNLMLLSTVPGSPKVVAGIALQGLWANSDGGTSWSKLGTQPGSASIVNRPSWIAYDPRDPTTFWESGMYNGGGAYRTSDSGFSFVQLGSLSHTDFISVDTGDPQRRTLLVGGHESARTVWKSSDGGQNWVNVGTTLPEGTGFSTDPLVIDAHTYLVNADRGWSQGAPGIFRTTDGGATWAKVSGVGPSGPPLVATDGTIYWLSGDGVVRSSDRGVNWERVGSGLAVRPIQLPDGRLASASRTTLLVSEDRGATWSPIGPKVPYEPAGLVYSDGQQAFYVWHGGCGSTVLADAIGKLPFAVGAAPARQPDAQPSEPAPAVDTPMPEPAPAVDTPMPDPAPDADSPPAEPDTETPAD